MHAPDAGSILGGPECVCFGLIIFVDRSAVDELSSVAGERGLDAVGRRRDQGVQEVGGDAPSGLLVQLDKVDFEVLSMATKEVEAHSSVCAPRRG